MASTSILAHYYTSILSRLIINIMLSNIWRRREGGDAEDLPMRVFGRLYSLGKTIIRQYEIRKKAHQIDEPSLITYY